MHSIIEAIYESSDLARHAGETTRRVQADLCRVLAPIADLLCDHIAERSALVTLCTDNKYALWFENGVWPARSDDGLIVRLKTTLEPIVARIETFDDDQAKLAARLLREIYEGEPSIRADSRSGL